MPRIADFKKDLTPSQLEKVENLERQYEEEIQKLYIQIHDLISTNEELNKKNKESKLNIITTKKVDEEIVLSYKQLIVILEALYNYKTDIKKLGGNMEAKIRHNYKLNEIQEIYEYIEQGVKYNFDSAVNKCKDRRLKQLNQNQDDNGMETFSRL